MQYHSAGLTDVGQRRKLNEDAFFVDDDLGLYVVADGMGGHAAGEIASQEAVDTVHGMVSRGQETLDRVARGDTSEDSLRKAIRVVESAVQAATYMVFGLAQHDPEQQGMGGRAADRGSHPRCVAAQAGNYHRGRSGPVSTPKRHHPRRWKP
ncbi:MAG: protein phosphatase 2C domain-containing protein [Deltaproteobacteria bacterium]|nr:protein phosphatase 2C domain-containing protein [Deltaproteobacteria bacterium]